MKNRRSRGNRERPLRARAARVVVGALTYLMLVYYVPGLT